MNNHSEIIKNYCTAKHIEVQLQERLLALPESEQEVFSRIITELDPSNGNFRSYWELLFEISHRDSREISKIFNEAEIIDVFSQNKTPRKDKQKKLRKVLETFRYPKLARIKEELHNSHRLILNRYGLNVSYPDDLEGDTLSVSITARKPGDLLAISESLAKLSLDEEINRMFSLLKGEGLKGEEI